MRLDRQPLEIPNARTRPAFVVALAGSRSEVPDLHASVLAAAVHPATVALKADARHAAAAGTNTDAQLGAMGNVRAATEFPKVSLDISFSSI